MNRSFFGSLVLGFGATLAVLVAVAMPPGGWGVAVGVMLGLLASLPLLLVLVLLLKRERAHPYSQRLYEEQAAPQVPVIILQQPAQTYSPYERQVYLSQGQAYEEIFDYPQAVGAYGYYEQDYDLNRPLPKEKKVRQGGQRQSQPTRKAQAGYYGEAYQPEDYAPDVFYAEPEIHGRPSETGPAQHSRYYGSYEEYTQSEPDVYAEQAYTTPRRERLKAESGYYNQTGSPFEPAGTGAAPYSKKSRRSIVPARPEEEPLDAEFWAIGEV